MASVTRTSATSTPLHSPPNAPRSSKRIRNMMEHICNACCKESNGRTKMFLCGRCRLVSYCSERCQKVGWNDKQKPHKTFCGILARVHGENIPSNTPSSTQPEKPKPAEERKLNTDEKAKIVSKKVCDHCGVSPNSETKLNLCTGCRVVLYCSKACQRERWRIHKHMCSLFASTVQRTLSPPTINGSLSSAERRTKNASKRICDTCGVSPNPETKLNLCTGCRVVRYCSKACQRKRWRIHKHMCAYLHRLFSAPLVHTL